MSSGCASPHGQWQRRQSRQAQSARRQSRADSRSSLPSASAVAAVTRWAHSPSAAAAAPGQRRTAVPGHLRHRHGTSSHRRRLWPALQRPAVMRAKVLQHRCDLAVCLMRQVRQDDPRWQWHTSAPLRRDGSPDSPGRFTARSAAGARACGLLGSCLAVAGGLPPAGWHPFAAAAARLRTGH